MQFERMQRMQMSMNKFNPVMNQVSGWMDGWMTMKKSINPSELWKQSTAWLNNQSPLNQPSFICMYAHEAFVKESIPFDDEWIDGWNEWID